MIRIAFISLAAVALATGLLAAEPKELQSAKKDFEKAGPHPTEADRVRYLTALVSLREKLARGKTDGWKAVDAEIQRHPVAKDSDGKALSKLMVGEWVSPRHEYVYRKDGTWSMLPAEPDATRGRWNIEGNQFTSIVVVDGKEQSSHDTILLLTEKDYVSTDGETVFYETRKSK